MGDPDPRTDYLPLPYPMTDRGTVRKVGVEIELSGLNEVRVARILRDICGGTIDRTGAYELRLRDSTLGTIKVYLDTAYRDRVTSEIADVGMSMARAVVPVELVFPPLPASSLATLDDIREALRRAGASGSRNGLFLGFGVHFNPEWRAPELAAILPVLRAFAFLEDYLRDTDQIDPARRVLPFVDPYPRRLVDALAADPPGSIEALIDLYLSLTPTRNRALDMLPAFKELMPEKVRGGMGGGISARPTFHYRLPDCRIDEEGWTLAYEWNRWVLVENVASHPTLLGTLAEDWKAHRASWITSRFDWPRMVAKRLAAAGLVEERA
ncbi:amidoligase family protein [Roseicyclus sp. F158]|uniref:Amidoligase family protein n=1 Tax=Tropicimonas omnivorans TaxID=3075590 RepID=A0ABU3DFN9_9RHOB|nr:amidoligase family protein [Roseicyclus sp. F158]MDT0682525.1 amidoligase family protein [Roseicyclus sp. F158]